MNQYHIYEKIGKGKYSTVYKGRRKKTISYYAIKSVDKSQKARVLQEVRTMHALDHKNILRFCAWYEFCSSVPCSLAQHPHTPEFLVVQRYETTNHLWLILEYCVGGDLMSLLRQDVRLPESSVHDFGRDLVVALQYLHHNSIIYCDLKPSNILLDENGRLKLGGFGLSRRLSDINKTPLLALPPAKRGTPCYMAPELFSEGATHSSASDLWALGCVLYESAMGRPPFLNSSFNQLVQEILHNDFAPIPGSSPEFTHLLSRLLDKNPATRIGWQELAVHPFWQAKLSWLAMPAEPALEQFISKFNLAPGNKDARASMASQTAAQSLRQSVDVNRLSRIALSNLEKESDGSDYAAVEAKPGDIRIDNADAELDFDEQKDDAEEDEPQSPAQNDDGATIDQGAALGESGNRIATLTKMTAADSVQRGTAMARARGAEPASNGAATANATGQAGTGQDQASVKAVPPTSGAKGPGVTTLTQPADTDGGGQQGTLPSPSTAGGPSPAMDALIWHASDAAVKPIVANRRIERLPEPRYEAKSLPFTPLSLQEMLHADQKELENFLTLIYRAIASAAPLKDKVNVLSYFETLCVDTNSANVLINSSLAILFIRMMRNARAPTLRIRLASVLGLLVRHATFIAEELAQTGVIDILTEALKDKNERVRRRVMATLGELLFYIATQQQDAQNGATAQEVSESWSINGGTVAAVARLLKPSEDEVAQHYAVKTIENICSQGGDWAAKFTSQEVAASLVQIYSSTKAENLKATTASTLARLLRHSPQLVAAVVDKFGIHLFVAGVTDPSSKAGAVQTAAINMLNMALTLPELSTRAKSALAEERGLVPSLMQLLDHSVPLLRSKSIVTLLLLSRLSTRWLLEACKAKFIPAVERLQREKDEYLQQAITALREEMGRLVPGICSQVTEELGKPGTRKAASPGRAVGSNKNPLQQFQVVVFLVTSPFFRSVAVSPGLIASLGSYLTASGSQGVSAAALAEFKETMMHVVESICQARDQQGSRRAATPPQSAAPDPCNLFTSFSLHLLEKGLM
ncbi:hypothetical protein QJQ45_014112 [Haematococcus lacustris]|nr:hypothetical protein QJQ45_014112 [Haematococcus lacustris]